MATSVSVSATNNADIDGLLSGYKWTGAITYSFPDSSSDYANPYTGGSSEPTTTGFASAPTQMQAAINYAIGLILGYTNANITYAGTNGADIMIAQSPAANPTSYAYYPGNYASGGDIWFGTHYDYTQAKLGNYYFTTALHELGHALGLKHSQETGGPANVAVPSSHDDSEYTVMSYRSYVGASTTAGYTNEAYGYPQTYMANDILALQTLYGANYTTQSGNTVYTWSPTTGQEFINGVGQPADGGGVGGSANRIYETIWDGNGVDTYDLSNYTTNLSINLNPGASSVFSTVQLAYLGDGHYAAGNVYNAYLFNGDARSYIDNAIANVLNGGTGDDTITGGGGNDTIIGGSGTDTAVYASSRSNYSISYNASTQTFTFVDLTYGSPDGTDTITGVENFQFADGTLSSTALINQVGNRTIEAIGTTSFVQLNGYYYLNPTAGGTGPTLKDGGSAVAVGQYALTPLGAEQVGSGYYVAWKSMTYDQYLVYNVDSTGNRSAFDVVSYESGTSYALESVETSFHQDLNGDGTIGVVTTVIESAGITSLTQVANNYYFYQSGVGPELKRDIVPVIAGQFSPFVPIGVEKTSTGYDLAWKVPGADQYIVWNVDNSGNFIANLTSIESGNSTVMESYETIFHQDFNGDGTIGIPAGAATTVIESAGSTSLTQIGNNYFFYESGTGPELMRGGAAVVAGQFAPFVPIGVEKTSTGYDLAWKAAGADQYIIWSVDSSGNFVSNLTSVESGSSTTIETFENVFHQDLNGDGTIGIPGGGTTTVIESAGTTSLTQVGSNYFLYQSGSGPELMRGGSAVVANQFAPFTPIGAEKTSTGYDVAWKVAGADQYIIWSVDSSGNFLSNLSGVESGSSVTIESFENVFHQDLNGDGTIGIPGSATTTVIESAGNTSLTQVGSNFYFLQSGSGPELMRGGAAVVANQFAPFTPIGVEKTATGYDLAWKATGADQYIIWNVDNNGNFVANLTGVESGSSSTLKSYESIFQQDLNGDGVISPASASPTASAAETTSSHDTVNAELLALLAHDFLIR